MAGAAFAARCGLVRDVTGADDLNDPDNWSGGFYELSVNLGPPDDRRLDAAIGVLWTGAGVRGCVGGEPGAYEPVECGLSALERFGHLRGVVRLPDGAQVVCGLFASRDLGGEDWLDFYLPLESLGRHDPRIGGFPFGSEPSRTWREPLNAWLTQLARDLFAEVPFRYALVDFETDPLTLEQATAGGRRTYGALVAVDDGLVELPPTH
jgi:hypothetical protein